MIALASPDTAEFEFGIARAGGGKVVCTRGAESTIVHVDLSQSQPVPPGAQLLDDFLDEFQAAPEVQRHLPEVRREIARERREAGCPETVRELRLSVGLSQSDFAGAIGTSQSMVSLIEARKQKPGEDTIRSMAAVLQVDFNTLMTALANG